MIFLFYTETSALIFPTSKKHRNIVQMKSLDAVVVIVDGFVVVVIAAGFVVVVFIVFFLRESFLR